MQECAKLFDLYDTKRQGKVQKIDVPSILRACGVFLPSKDMDALLARIPTEWVTKAAFDELIRSHLPSKACEAKDKELINALRAFDHKELGTLTKVEVLMILCQMNDKISRVDADIVLEGLVWEAGDKVKIEDLAQHLLRPISKMHINAIDCPSRMKAAQ